MTLHLSMQNQQPFVRLSNGGTAMIDKQRIDTLVERANELSGMLGLPPVQGNVNNDDVLGAALALGAVTVEWPDDDQQQTDADTPPTLKLRTTSEASKLDARAILRHVMQSRGINADTVTVKLNRASSSRGPSPEFIKEACDMAWGHVQ